MTDFGKSTKGPTLVDLTAVANNSTNIDTVSTNIADVQTIAAEINNGLVTSINSVINSTLSLSGLTDTDLPTMSQSQDGYALTWDWDTGTSTGDWVPQAPITQISSFDVTDPSIDGNGLQFDSTANGNTGGYVAANFLFADSATQEISTAKISDITSPAGYQNQLAVVNSGGTRIEFSDTKSGNLTVTGNLTVQGDVTTVTTSNLAVSDSLIELSNGSSGAQTNDAGLIIQRGTDGDNAIFAWDRSQSEFVFGLTTATGASIGDLTITPTNVKLADLTLTGIAAGSVFAPGSAGSATWDVTAAQMAIITASGATTVTISNASQLPIGAGLTLIVNDAAGAGLTIGGAASFKYPSATAPALSGTATNEVLVVSFIHTGSGNLIASNVTVS